MLILGNIYFALRTSFINCFCLHNSKLAKNFSIGSLYCKTCSLYCILVKNLCSYRFTLLQNRCQMFIGPHYNQNLYTIYKREVSEKAYCALIQNCNTCHFFWFFWSFCPFIYLHLFSVAPATCRVACAVNTTCHLLIGGFQLSIKFCLIIQINSSTSLSWSFSSFSSFSFISYGGSGLFQAEKGRWKKRIESHLYLQRRIAYGQWLLFFLPLSYFILIFG